MMKKLTTVVALLMLVVMEGNAGTERLFKAQNGADTKDELRIVEIEFIEKLKDL